jgi:hypothetical protein
MGSGAYRGSKSTRPRPPKRLYQYHHRLEDRFQRQIETLAVLADQRTDWRPICYEKTGWGCRVRLEFASCKLLDFKDQAGRLEQSPNPIDLVILAHLRSLESKEIPAQRKKWKTQITRLLYDRGLTRDEILDLFLLIDWLMALPEALEVEFKQELSHYEAEKNMPYITSIERLGRQEGRQEALREDILAVLETRFVSLPDSVPARIKEISDEDKLKTLHRKAVVTESVDAFLRELGSQ